MNKVCDKHAEKPVTIYSQCIGCELENLHQQIKEQAEVIKFLRDKLRSDRIT